MEAKQRMAAKHRRLITIGLALAVLITGLLLSQRARGVASAVYDLSGGTPKYYFVSGEPPEYGLPPYHPAHLDQLRSHGVRIVDTGCLGSTHDEAYDAVIAAYYGVEAPYR